LQLLEKQQQQEHIMDTS